MTRITALVKEILEQKPETRDDDNALYYEVISKQAKEIYPEYVIPMATISIGYFLLNCKKKGFTGFETVRRSRQKIQADNPHLRASRKVEEGRMINEAEMREWARGRQC